MKMGNTGHIARMGKMRNSCKCIYRKPVGNRPVCRPKRKGEDNIKMNLMERRYDSVAGFMWLRIRTAGEMYCKGQ